MKNSNKQRKQETCFQAVVYCHVLGHGLAGVSGQAWPMGCFSLGLCPLPATGYKHRGDVVTLQVPEKEAPEVKAVGI